MGEAEFRRNALVSAIETGLREQVETSQELRVATPGGRFQVRWDEGGQATALGQLAFFAEFLEVSGLFNRWVDGCPMSYTSANAPAVVDVLGTWMLSILDGQHRYAHVAGLRGDAVAPRILGMNKIVSDESLRRALAHLAPCQTGVRSEEQRALRAEQLAKSTGWMDAALAESTSEALRTPWVLDVDSSVKLLYGHQAAAEVSPAFKHGRSHCSICPEPRCNNGSATGSAAWLDPRSGEGPQLPRTWPVGFAVKLAIDRPRIVGRVVRVVGLEVEESDIAGTSIGQSARHEPRAGSSRVRSGSAQKRRRRSGSACAGTELAVRTDARG